MIYLLYPFLIISLALFAKSILFWVYLWQLKEYRLDRLLAEYKYSRPKKVLQLWFFSGGRKFWRPIWTMKSASLVLLSLIAVVVASLLAVFDYTLILIYLLIYLSIPIFVALLVFLFKIPTNILKSMIYAKARRKIKKMKNLIVIGITGSYGKSSTKEFLYQILSRKFKVAKTPLNVNSEIGVAKYVLNGLPPDAEFFIVEMGAYRRGEIRRICRFIQPKIGILTGISEQHLALFGSLENIKKAKYELIENLPVDGLAVFNGENKYCLELAEKWKGRGIIYRGNALQIYKKIPRHYELNLNAAIDVAKYLGMTMKEIDEAIKNLSLAGNMIKSFSTASGALIIDDTYSANPDGVLAALDYLGSQIKGYKVIIMPCLIELSEAAPAIHEKIGQKIREVCDLAVVITADYFNDIKKGAGDKAVLAETAERVEMILRGKLNQNAAVLLEGRIPQNIIDVVKT